MTMFASQRLCHLVSPWRSHAEGAHTTKFFSAEGATAHAESMRGAWKPNTPNRQNKKYFTAGQGQAHLAIQPANAAPGLAIPSDNAASQLATAQSLRSEASSCAQAGGKEGPYSMR